MKHIVLLLTLLFIFNTTAVSTINTAIQNKRCLAETIYMESRGEPYIGKLAVGQVVMNRVRHPLYPNTICQVIFQKGQFPWTKEFGGFKAPESFIKLADLILSGKHELSNFKATHFHATYVNPRWNLKKVGQIGNHIFYKI